MAGEFQSGSAWIPVRPDFKGFHKTIAKEFGKLTPMVQSMGQQMGEDFANAIRRGLGNDPISGPLQEDTKKQRSRAPKDGADVGGAFAQGFKKRVAAAMKTLPKAELDADASEAHQKVQSVRSALESLSATTVGVDIDAAAAVGELRALKAELEGVAETADLDVRADTAAATAQLDALLTQIGKVDATYAEVEVDADTAGANAQLAATEAQVDALDGRTARVDVDVSGALAGLGMLSIAAAGVAAIPIGASLTAGVGAMLAPLTAATAGVGALALVAVPAFGQIGEALELQKAAAEGGAEEMAAYQSALSQMSPAAATLTGDVIGLKTEFSAWSESLQPDVLPIFSQGIGLISGRLTSLNPLVTGSAEAVSGLITRLDTALSSPFWTGFGERMSNFAPTAITGLGVTLGNIATGFAGIINAFLPYAPAFLDWLTRITGQFAEWGTGLGDSEGFRSFMSYALDTAPLVGDFIAALSGAVTNLLAGLAPLGPLALGGFGALLQVIAQLPPPVITALAVAITGVVLATKAWAIGSMLFGKSAPIMSKGIKGIGVSLKGAFMSNPIGIIITALTSLIPLVLWAWNNIDWFRNGLLAAWDAIKTGALWLWDNALQPLFTNLVSVIQTYVVPAILWLWQTVLQPALANIGALFTWLWTTVIQPVFTLWWTYITTILVPALLWFWQTVVVPVFTAIGAIISWAWNTIIKPVFNFWWSYITTVLVPVLMFLWQNVVVPVFNAIGAVIGWAWNTLIKPVFTALWSFITTWIVPILQFLWTSVVVPVWRGIGAAISFAWNSIIKPLWGALRTGISVLIIGPFLKMRARVTAVWALLRSVLRAGWNWIRDHVFTPVKNGVDAVKDAFSRAASGIKTVWNRIKGYTKDPINFVIQTVYMDGIRALAGKVLGAVGVDKNPLPSFKKIATGGVWQGPGRVARYAGGGIMPGYTPGRDVHRFYSPTGGGLELSGGEAILRPEVTRVLGSSMIHEVNALARNGGVTAVKRRFDQSQGFARGGIWGPMPVQSFARGGIASAISGGWDWVTGKVDEISGAAKKWFLDKLDLSSLLGAIPGGGFMSTFAKALFRKILVPKIGNLINKKDEEYGGSSDAVVKAALKYAKNPGIVGGDYNNKFQRAFGMPGQPWCAMFVSEVIKEAKASKKYNNISHAHSRAFRSGLPHGKASNAKPGWIATYGAEPSHINIIAYRKGGQNYTIGGNEGNTVKGPRVYGAASHVMKPKYAAGGVVDRRVLKQDYRENRERTTPLQTQFLRSAFGLRPYATGGWIRGLSGDRNLLLGADGEFVVNATAARENGGLLEALNSGRRLPDVLAAAGPAGLSASQQRALASLATAPGGGSTVNAELHLHNGEATVRNAFRELRYEVHRSELGGKYGG